MTRLTNHFLQATCFDALTLACRRQRITDYLITDYLLFPEVLHIITGCFIESQTVKFAVGSDSG